LRNLRGIWPAKPSLESFWIVVTQGYWYLEYFWQQFGNSLYVGLITVIAVVPTAAESGLPGFEALQYYGLSAPAGTPRPIVERLNKELRSMIESEEMRKHIVAEGADPIASTPEEYAANIVREEGKWATLIKKLGLKIE